MKKTAEIDQLLHGYVNERCMISHLVNGRALRFTEEGMARLASVIGWLTGLSDAGCKHTEMLAGDFIDRLDWLSTSEEIKVSLGKIKHSVPIDIVKLSDDGTKHGFSLCWYQYYKTCYNSNEANQLISQREGSHKFITDGSYPCHIYQYDYNGGLIYHGPKSLEAMEKWEPSGDSYCWGIHT